jgi:DNA-binding CsgD family transcriptional regulator
MGAAQRAHDAVLAAAGGEDLPLISRVGRSTAYEVLTRAELLLGRLEAAEGWARRAEADTRGGELAIETATAARAIAAVALARGDADRAAAVSLDGAARADAVGAPVEAARCRILAGRALAAHGRRTAAIAELEGAASALGRVGAGGYRAEAERELRRLGRRVPRRSPAGAPALRSLTERERRVAGLVGRGQTNRAIADALCLSKRTIERDLSRIFEKLGVSSRSALASIIAGADRLNLRGPLEP